MTKITLIQPPFLDRLIHFPIGLGYLAAVLEKNDIDVSIVDLNFSDKRILRRLNFSDVVGISCMTKTFPSVLKVVKEINDIDSDIPIILGGHHPSVAADSCLFYPEIDFCVIGEGEYTLLDLVKILKSNGDVSKVKGIAFRNGGKVKYTEPRPLIQNLDELPFPAYHLFDLKNYSYNIIGVGNAKKIPWISIVTSRGCPFHCIFCKRIYGQTYRARSPENVLAEMEFLVSEYKIKEFLIVDDNFTLIRERAEKICDLIIERGLDVIFRFPNGIRADCVDFELLKKLKNAGMYKTAFGIESGSPRMLKIMKKNLDLNKIRKAVRMCRVLGIENIGFFVIGLPGETHESALQTIKFAKELPLDDASFYIATPYPGTEFFNWVVKRGYINPENLDWGKLDLLNYTSVSRTDDLTSEEISELVKKASREFYFRPITFMRKFSRMHSLKELRIAFGEATNWFKIHSKYYSRKV
jgi:radical SAM superfamily enzyme YgiQ (UPF0313 family)